MTSEPRHHLSFRPLTEGDSDTIVAWRYDQPHAIYNLSPDDLRWLVAPKNAHCAILRDASELIGYCCFGHDARVPGDSYDTDALDVGLGLRPGLTGRGPGLSVLDAKPAFARTQYAPPAFRLTVATFNLRPIRVYERAGFRSVSRFASPHWSREYVPMIRGVSADRHVGPRSVPNLRSAQNTHRAFIPMLRSMQDRPDRTVGHGHRCDAAHPASRRSARAAPQTAVRG